jgi:hypothetical protein
MGGAVPSAGIASLEFRRHILFLEYPLILNFEVERTGVAPSPSELSFKLDAHTTDQVRRISAQTGVSPDALMGVALRFLFIAADARARNRRMLVTSDCGYPIRELGIPAS